MSNKKAVQPDILVIDTPVVDALASLGRDYSGVSVGLSESQAEFKRMDNDSWNLFSATSATWKAQLLENRRAFTEQRPLECSVFVYFDLSTSVDVIDYVSYIRAVIGACLHDNWNKKVRYSDLQRQHTTAFIEMIGQNLDIMDEPATCVVPWVTP